MVIIIKDFGEEVSWKREVCVIGPGRYVSYYDRSGPHCAYTEQKDGPSYHSVIR